MLRNNDDDVDVDDDYAIYICSRCVSGRVNSASGWAGNIPVVEVVISVAL